jgi:hypothetical protein
VRFTYTTLRIVFCNTFVLNELAFLKKHGAQFDEKYLWD